jgi:DNA-binding FadR family transcriptional regulator
MREGTPAMGATTERVEAAIRALATGKLSAGDRLPSERSLAHSLGAGRTTVRLVLVKLAAEGLVRAEHGRGYFVCERPG